MNHKWILSLPENSPTDCSIRKKKHGNLKASQHLAFKSHENVEIGSTCKKNITDLAAEEISQQIAIMHTESYLAKVDIALVCYHTSTTFVE